MQWRGAKQEESWRLESFRTQQADVEEQEENSLIWEGFFFFLQH